LATFLVAMIVILLVAWVLRSHRAADSAPVTATGMIGFPTAWCGVSQEPRALALAGLQVAGFDVSPRAIELVQQ
jgi:hypothetical protein